MRPMTEEERKGMVVLSGILVTMFVIGYLLGAML